MALGPSERFHAVWLTYQVVDGKGLAPKGQPPGEDQGMALPMPKGDPPEVWKV